MCSISAIAGTVQLLSGWAGIYEIKASGYQTGDNSNIILFGTFALMAAGVLASAKFRKQR